MNPDDWYRCRRCDELFNDQIRYEMHLCAEHGRLRDTLPILTGF